MAAGRGHRVDHEQGAGRAGECRDLVQRVERPVRRLGVNDGDEIDVFEAGDRRRDRRRLGRLARLRHDIGDGSAAPPQPGAEIAAIGARDDIDRHEAGPREARRRRLQRQQRLGLDEEDIGSRVEQSLQPVGERRIGAGAERRDVEQRIERVGDGRARGHGDFLTGARRGGSAGWSDKSARQCRASGA